MKFRFAFLIVFAAFSLNIFAQNNALHFDGSHDYVNIGDVNALDGTSKLTIEMWVKIENWQDWRTFFSKNFDSNRIQFQLYETDGSLGIAIEPGVYVYSSSSVVYVGEWFHLAMVFDGTLRTVKLFINGDKVALSTYRGSVPATTPSSSGPVLLGAERTTYNDEYPYQGKMDNVRIWTVARTQTEIQQNMNRDIPADETGLVMNFLFNQGTAGGNNSGVTTLFDQTSNDHDGTLYNFALTGSTSNWVERDYTAPTVGATNVTASDTYPSQIDITWSSGSGSQRAAFMIAGTSGAANPENGTTYTANTVFQSGDQIGTSGWYCIYNGTGTGVSVSGLSPATTYRVHVCEYNGSEGSELYLIDPQTNNPNNVTTDNADVTFTDGSGFTPVITSGNADQVIGRFTLTGDIAGANLTVASIKLNGTRTGLSNLKLWGSTDATFEAGSDTQLGSTVAADPGDGSSASFASFSSAIGTGGTYYFLTGDVSAGAAGAVQGVIVANGNLTLANGVLSGSISNAPLSNGDASLPVELASFTANVQGNSIVLNWQTASETDNLGFILERAESNSAWQPIASYQACDALKGQGNKSTTTSYTWTDINVSAGTEYRYRLGDVNTAGMVTMYSPISVTMTALPQSTEMQNAYPNPFNPETIIKYQLHKDSQISITVYDLLGRKVKTLIDEQQTAGAYQALWNGTDASGNKAASGAYLIRMKTNEITQIQKVLLMK